MRRTVSKSQKRDRIVDAAIRLFADADLSQVSMDDIARCAGVAKGTLYNYFRSKEDLYIEAIRHRFKKLVSLLERAFRTRRQPQRDLRSFILHYEAFMRKHPHFFRLLQRSRTEPNYAASLEELDRNVATLLADVIRRGMRSGEFRNGSADFRARLILGMIERDVEHRINRRSRTPGVDGIMSFIRSGLVKRDVDA